ncbi:hypothetical protein [Streptomyces hydrogenans]|uniref:hypothetical protein n=1 Tax=Streptomyces hydrogenans TaxID=1873719 RepID=UPI0038168CC1
MTNRQQRRGLLKRKGSSTLVNATAVALRVYAWNRDHPGELPPLIARKHRESIDARSDRVWRVLVHHKLGHITLADVCHTCRNNPTKEKR